MVARRGLRTAVPDALTAPLVARPIQWPWLFCCQRSPTSSRIRSPEFPIMPWLLRQNNQCAVCRRRGTRRRACRGFAPSRAIYPAEADAVRVLVLQDSDGIAVEDGDDRAGEVGGKDQNRTK